MKPSSKSILEIAIVGSGAIGLFYGIKLAKGGLDVRFLFRSDLEAALRSPVIGTQIT